MEATVTVTVTLTEIVMMMKPKTIMEIILKVIP